MASSAGPFPNQYRHRKVKLEDSKPCTLCHKFSSSVLISSPTEGGKQDFFYICPSHLKEKKFCSPIIDEAAAAAKKKKEMEEEVARVKKEYEEKQRKKKEKEAERSKGKGKDKDKDKDKDKEKDKKEDPSKDGEKEKTEEKETEEEEEEEEPKDFSLHNVFYQQRVALRRQAEDQRRRAEMSRLNRERMQKPDFFPSVPSGQPS